MHSEDRFNKIKKQWIEFKNNPKNKKTRIRDAAKELKTTEAELLSTEIGEKVFYLKVNDYESFFKSLLNIDKLMTLIRTDYVVHELIIKTSKINFKNNSLIDLNNNLNLLTFDADFFQHIFFEKKTHAGKELKSFQFFDVGGDSLIKIYLKGLKSDEFDEIAKQYKYDYNYELQNNNASDNINPIQSTSYLKTEYKMIDDSPKKHIINNNILKKILEESSDKKVNLKIHASGNNSSQIYRGRVKNIIEFGPWINVIDKNFNLHVLENQISQSVVREYDNLIIVSFIDSNNQAVLEIGPEEGHENEFKNIIGDIDG